MSYQELCQTVVQIEKQVKNEKARSSVLNAKLEPHYKTVRMFTRSKELDKILSLERQDQTSRGLGYTGYGKSDTKPIKFVPSSNSKGKTTTEVQIGKENLCLKKEKSWLEDTVIKLRKELDDERKKEANTSDLKKENVRLAVHIELLEKQVKNEKARSSVLNAKLEHHYKTVRMFTRSKELDKILSLERQDQTSRGLGYTGYGKSDTKPIKFVPSSNSKGETTTEAEKKNSRNGSPGELGRDTNQLTRRARSCHGLAHPASAANYSLNHSEPCPIP
ncbi:hypothetical protein F2Q69_00046692 [Brassica cretica]|uniref:Uncharacterized protein n=1 Tax=Brassica cretica TaxID=69181 RepID=A0A8S9PTQ7_BRACR|nr:hypothetical protein F2Q69_00046692 [Brassica cretica]